MPFDNLTTYYATLYALLELCALAAAGHAIMHARTSQGTIAWALSLVTVPFIALPAYWILSQRKFSGYVKARRAGDVRVKGMPGDLVAKSFPNIRAPLPGDLQRWRPLENLAKMPFLRANRVDLLVDGEATFTAIFAALERASDYVLVQFYLVNDDTLGRALHQRLVEKVRGGVRVFFLYDEIGSRALPAAYLRELREAGVDIRPFSSTQKGSNRFRINFRNHRKIVVVDGREAFVGGHNVGDEYMGQHPTLTPWRDTHIKLTGPAALSVQLTFLEDWNWAANMIPQLNTEPHILGHDDQAVLVLPTGPADTLDTCSLFFIHAINAAKHRVWIVSPYFVPDEPVVAAMQLAALRGVEVRILLPTKADARLVHLAGFSYYEETIGAGVKLYRYEKGFLHQKVMLVDDDLAAVGTANLDNRSFRLNFEITLVVADQGFAHQVAQMLEQDFADSRRIELAELERRSLAFRVAVRTARLFSPIL